MRNKHDLVYVKNCKLFLALLKIGTEEYTCNVFLLQNEVEQISAQLEQADTKNIHMSQKLSSLEAQLADSQVSGGHCNRLV